MKSVLPQSYARARLLLGMSGVGLFVVLAFSALIFNFPERFLPGSDANLGEEFFAVITFVAIYTAISAPFDWLGGYLLPRLYHRRAPNLNGFTGAWLRGILLHSLLLVLTAMLLLLSGKLFGFPVTILVVAALMIFLLRFQEETALVIGTIKPIRKDNREVDHHLRNWGVRHSTVRVYTSQDEGFTGGIAGFPGREQIILPHHWIKKFDSETLALLISRRTRLIRGEERTLGVAIAYCWNLFGFAAAGLVTGADPGAVSGITTLSLGFTLWSFLGLLMLPSLSRYGVLAADRSAAKFNRNDRLQKAISALDRMQDDEPSRPPLVETIFHPLPSVESRLHQLNALDTGSKSRGATPWNSARLSLYLSWAGLNLLSRAVHCNAGRPDLWVFLPVD